MIIDCKSIAQDIKNKIKNIIAEADYAPVLYIYQVGDNPASNAYIRGKLRDCEEVGVEANLIKLPEDITDDELNNKILEDYNWEDVDGIIVQLPLPKHMEDIKVTPRIGGVGLMTRAMLLYNVCVAKYGEYKMEEVIG